MKQKNIKTAVKTISIMLVLPLFILMFTCFASAEVATEYESDDLKANFTSATVKSTLEINAKSVVLMEVKTGKILYENNKDERLAPASVTKIMSLLLVMEAIENERITLQTPVTASAHAASMGGSQIWLKENEVMTVDELLRASVIASANDATVALAEAVAGSEEAFVDLMNEKAKMLGMKNTHFVNACGLDTDGHLTTANDVAIMASELIKHELIKNYSTVWMDALRNGKSELVNTNKLVRYYSGATGLKTGTTSKAGSCVAATAERNGLSLVAVVMGAVNSNERFSGAKKLLDSGFANWAYESYEADISSLKPINVKKGTVKTVTGDVTGKIELLTEKSKAGKVTQKIEMLSDLKAPVKVGDEIGKVIFTLDGKEVGKLSVTAAHDVPEITFFNSFIALLSSVFTP